MDTSHSALTARGLRKHYGGTAALDGFDLTVSPGSVHALLGPNGAGKSTAVHTLATLTRVEEGEATVAGFDVRTRPGQVRAAIGLVGQSAALDEILFGRENLVTPDRCRMRRINFSVTSKSEIAPERSGRTATM